jgi:hypothetical protein
MRFKHYSIGTETTYHEWIKRFIFFHSKRHPREIGALEVERFLSDLATTRKVAASTQNQAFNALLFLYHEVLHQDWGELGRVQRAKRTKGKNEPANERKPEKVHWFHAAVFSGL